METKTPTKEEVFEALNEIQGIKVDTHKFPSMVFAEEIVNFLTPEYPDVNKQMVIIQLRELYKENKIEHNKTVNGQSMFGVIQQPITNNNS